MRAIGLGALGLICVGSDASADFYEDAFGAFETGRVACYARRYDSAHLRAHPRQKVVHFSLAMLPENADGRSNTRDDFQLRVGVDVKGKTERYYGYAYCKAETGVAHCFLEGDGGRMSLTLGDGGRLRVEAGSYGLAFEGSDFEQIGADLSDDTVFLLDRSTAEACAETSQE